MSVVDGDQYLLALPTKTGKTLQHRGRDRDREAARLKALGWSFEEIAQRLDLTSRHTGQPDPYRAAAAIKRAMAEAIRFAGDEMRLMELKSLDELEALAWRTLRNRHPLVQQGRIVRNELDEALDDDRYILELIDRILRIKERRAKLLGLDAPVRSEVITMDSVEAEISRLEAELRSGS